MTKKVPEILREMAELYEERGKVYGDNYKRHGEVMAAMFPKGVQLNTVADHNRFGILTQVVAKLTRYAENFDRGGHADSMDDTTVYSAMLSELDEMYSDPSEGLFGKPPEMAFDWSKLEKTSDLEPLVLDKEAFLKDEAEHAGDALRYANPFLRADAPADVNEIYADVPEAVEFDEPAEATPPKVI